MATIQANTIPVNWIPPKFKVILLKPVTKTTDVKIKFLLKLINAIAFS